MSLGFLPDQEALQSFSATRRRHGKRGADDWVSPHCQTTHGRDIWIRSEQIEHAPADQARPLGR